MERQSRWVWVWTHWPPHWPAGLAVPLLAWCRGVDGIVDRGGHPWPMAAAQRPSGRRLAALATACFRQCNAKNSQCDSGVGTQNLPARPHWTGVCGRVPTANQGLRPRSMQAQPTGGAAWGLSLPPKPSTCKLQPARATAFLLNPHTRNLPFSANSNCHCISILQGLLL